MIKIKSDLRDKIAADIFVNFVADMKYESISSEVKEDADSEGIEIKTYLAKTAIELANNFIEVLNKGKSDRICG